MSCCPILIWTFNIWKLCRFILIWSLIDFAHKKELIFDKQKRLKSKTTQIILYKYCGELFWLATFLSVQSETRTFGLEKSGRFQKNESLWSKTIHINTKDMILILTKFKTKIKIRNSWTLNCQTGLKIMFHKDSSTPGWLINNKFDQP